MLQLKVDGMTCEHCVASVTRAVQSVAPGARVAVDLRTGDVAIDGAANAQQISTAISDAGFEVSVTRP